MSIPKTIHYCWFGGSPLPELAQKCIASWKKYCPGYEIIEWNESNFDINICTYTKEAYEAKKWAFVTDYVRLKVLYDYGGIYMDTDVEVLKPLDSLLQYEAVSGFESATQIPTGLIACRKRASIIGELLQDYDNLHFKNDDGSYNLTTNVIRITNTLTKYGLEQNNTFQTVQGFSFLPKEYLCPKDLETGVITITENTLTVHHFDGSWLSNEEKYTRELTAYFLKKYSYKTAHRIALVSAYTRYRGLFRMPFALLKLKVNNLRKKYNKQL